MMTPTFSSSSSNSSGTTIATRRVSSSAAFLTVVVRFVVVAICVVATTISPFALVDAATDCSDTAECERLLRVGSECVDGTCTNPFVAGCFKTILGGDGDDESEATTNDGTVVAETLRKHVANGILPPQALQGRVCNSDDAYDSENCLENDFGYFEIRIHNQNWEAAIFVSWIMQIVLSEVLRVPATVGLSSLVTSESGFYSPSVGLKYSSTAYALDALRIGVEMASFDSAGHNTTTADTDTDTTRRFLANNSNNNNTRRVKNCEATEEDCFHVLPELWSGSEKVLNELLSDHIIEPVDGCGQVGKIGWYIPGAVAEKDPSLMSHLGLRGEGNRAKLADTFRRPTTWSEYCEEVSVDNCTTPDGVAERYPNDDGEGLKYHAAGTYTGHFRLLPENNCTLFPTTCTGYITGPKCEWTNFVDSQLYWNDIVGLKQDGPLEPTRGYGWSNELEIWRASYATGAPVMFWWWQPEALVQEFASTEWNFQMISLPAISDTCFYGRISPDDRCSTDLAFRRGTPDGSCDNEANSLQKVLSSTLREQTNAVEEHSRSPGYQFVRALKISDLEIQSLLNAWMAIGEDKYGSDAREAVCSWVVENAETLMGFVPAGHPRTIVDASNADASILVYVAWAVAALGCAGILTIGAVVYKYRRTKVFIYAQVTFVYIILLGFFLVAVGGFLYALEPTDGTCVARSWLISLGYSIVLSAILVKMSAINRIMQVSKRRKRVKVSNTAMLMALSCLVSIDLIFLIVWTAVSPLKATETLFFADDADASSAIVERSTICMSRQRGWQYALQGWHTLLLLVAAVLAFASRKIRLEQFNESRVIGTMVYSQFFLMIARWIVSSLGSSMVIPPNAWGASMGLLFVVDAMLSTGIYVVPKCLTAKKAPFVYDPSRPSGEVDSNSSHNFFTTGPRSSNPLAKFSSHEGGNADSSSGGGKIRMSSVGLHFEFDDTSTLDPPTNNSPSPHGRQRRGSHNSIISYQENDSRSNSHKSYTQKSFY